MSLRRAHARIDIVIDVNSDSVGLLSRKLPEADEGGQIMGGHMAYNVIICFAFLVFFFFGSWTLASRDALHNTKVVSRAENSSRNFKIGRVMGKKINSNEMEYVLSLSKQA